MTDHAPICEITTVGKLREALERIDADTLIHCQAIIPGHGNFLLPGRLDVIPQSNPTTLALTLYVPDWMEEMQDDR